MAFTDLAEYLNSGYREQIQLAVRAELELGVSELQVQRSYRSASPRCDTLSEGTTSPSPSPPLQALFVTHKYCRAVTKGLGFLPAL